MTANVVFTVMYLLLLGQFVGRRGRTHTTMWLSVIAILFFQATGTVKVTCVQVMMYVDMIFFCAGENSYCFFCAEYNSSLTLLVSLAEKGRDNFNHIYIFINGR